MKEIAYFDYDGCAVSEFAALTSQELKPDRLTHADRVEENIPVYDMTRLRPVLESDARSAVLGEWGHVLGKSAGVLVLKAAFDDLGPIDAATAIYEKMIAREKAESGNKADHFAKAGANDRVWNSLQKLCEADPEVFALYFGNTAIAAASEAWLGPFYQMTAQVNLVRPGGAAQTAHRDYHLGFQTSDIAARFPAHAHDLSAVMTLQGAVAHCDMPVESGPTKLLPFSQLYRPGYMAYRREDFRAYFEDHCVQLPLEKGDALFFNPALFHAGGENRTPDVQRMANLLQVSSAFGRALEAIDRTSMCRRLYPAIQSLFEAGRLDPARVAAAVGACAEGYSFPTNLDSDPPVGGLAPETQAALFHRALAEGMSAETFEQALDAQAARRHA